MSSLIAPSRVRTHAFIHFFIQWRSAIDARSSAISSFSSPKFARVQDWRLCFLGSQSVYRLRFRFANILNWYWWNQTLIYHLYPYLYSITNIYHSSSRQTMAQSGSYSCGQLAMRRTEWDVFDLITKFLQSSNENQNYAPWELLLFTTSHCLYS
jgi:hypothetical protein